MIENLSQPGDLLFYKVTPQSGWKAKLIALVQLFRKEGVSSSYSHVAIRIWNKELQAEAVWPCTRISSINWDNSSIEVWRVKNINSWEIETSVSWSLKNTGRYYDIGQLLLGLFTLKNSYSCTEFVQTAFKQAEIILGKDAGRFIGPNELIDTKILERIF